MLIIHFYVLIIPTDLELSDAVIIAQLSLHGCSIATCISDERSIQRQELTCSGIDSKSVTAPEYNLAPGDMQNRLPLLDSAIFERALFCSEVLAGIICTVYRELLTLGDICRARIDSPLRLSRLGCGIHDCGDRKAEGCSCAVYTSQGPLRLISGKYDLIIIVLFQGTEMFPHLTGVMRGG